MKIIKKISDFLFMLFFLVFIPGIVITWTDFKIKTELPINDFAGFVVDSHQNIYIGDSFYSIIQKYDRTGNFTESFKVKGTSGKPFTIGVDTKDNIIVTLQTGREVVIYPLYRGETITERSYKKRDHNKFFITRNHEKYGNLGTRFPAIWKLSGTKEKVVEQSLFLQLLSFPSMMGVVLTAVFLKFIAFITEKWRKLRSET
ncbi:hypothetical protein [uncultured Chryseobacterium sp.]|uniref:hypothetical protein n=1 Tax=uncultured Chryseobacterium sp. TaxID=259322 RepID=UPI0025D3DEBF|nr:hypothetical protein [uncultured Chryseobacterium sp.]